MESSSHPNPVREACSFKRKVHPYIPWSCCEDKATSFGLTIWPGPALEYTKVSWEIRIPGRPSSNGNGRRTRAMLLE